MFARSRHSVLSMAHAAMPLGTAGSFVAGFAAAIVPQHSVTAAEWSAQGELQTMLEHRDNIRLEFDGGQAVQGAALSFSGVLARRMERSELTLRPHWRAVRYEQTESFDNEERSVGVSHRVSNERIVWQSSATAVWDTTLTSELETTGLVDARQPHRAESALTAATMQLTGRQQLMLQAVYQRNEYPDGASAGLVDYEYGTAVLSYTAMAHERMTAGFQLNAGRLFVPQSGMRNRDGALRMNLQYALNESSQLSLAVGADRTQTLFGASSGAVFGLEFTRRGERMDLKLSADRAVQPSGSGALMHTDDYSLSVTRHLNPYWSASLDLRYLRNEDLLAGAVRADRHYERAGVRLDWAFAEDRSLFCILGSSRQSFATMPDKAVGFDAWLGFVWSLPRKAISR